MANIPLATKPKVTHMLDHDSFLTVTENGLNRRLERKDLEVDENLSFIIDGYLNEQGELLLVLGDMLDNNPVTIVTNFIVKGGGIVADITTGPIASDGERLASADESVSSSVIGTYGLLQLGTYSHRSDGERLSDQTHIQSTFMEVSTS